MTDKQTLCQAAKRLAAAWTEESRLRKKMASFQCSGWPKDLVDRIGEQPNPEREAPTPCWKADTWRSESGDGRFDCWPPEPSDWCDGCKARHEVYLARRSAMQERGAALRGLLARYRAISAKRKA